MRITIDMLTDSGNGITVVGVSLRSRESVEKLIKQLQTEVDLVWPLEPLKEKRK